MEKKSKKNIKVITILFIFVTLLWIYIPGAFAQIPGNFPYFPNIFQYPTFPQGFYTPGTFFAQPQAYTFPSTFSTPPFQTLTFTQTPYSQFGTFPFYQQPPVFTNFPRTSFYPPQFQFPQLPFFPGFQNYYGFLPFSFFPPFRPPPPPPPPRVVPDVLDLAQADAEDDIVGRNLVVGNITLEFDANIPAGFVISQSPQADTTVPINSSVNLVVSRGPQMSVALELVATGLTAPVGLVASEDGTGRLFIVDQTGVVKILTADGDIRSEPFLDIQDNLGNLNENYDERGLLGLAFHPDYETEGRFFVYYSAPLRQGAPFGWDHTSHIAEYTVDSSDPNKGDPDSEEILMEVDQPQFNHNGGQLAFGPEDGYLYISLGDGGGADDTDTGHNPDIGNGQDISNPFGGLLGSILRIDVDSITSPLKYGIPDSNPFVDIFGLDEIFAFGFRNPFRMSFDSAGDHELFVADAGQNLWEEVNIVEIGENYGWNIKEGTHCFNPVNPFASPLSCPNVGPTGIPLTNPIIEYPNSYAEGGIGRAVIGGFVYRGDFLPDFVGKYVFGDWSISSEADGTLFMATPPPEDGVLWPFGEILVATSEDNRINEYVRSFGQDPNGELYVLTSETAGPSEETGKVYRMVPTSGTVPFVNVYDQIVFPVDEVTIAAVGYDRAGWIVIHDDTEIIGYEPVAPGINLDLTVDLTRDADDDETLRAMLHTDANNMGTFEFPGPDAPVIGDRGVVVVRSFTVELCTNPVVPDVVGLTLAEAEEEITSCNLDVGNITYDYSATEPPDIVIGQNPTPGNTVPGGTNINLLVSLGTVSFANNALPFNIQRDIFNARCTTCHFVGGFANFLPLTSGVSYNNLVNEPATRTGNPPTDDLVEPGDSANSVLYQRVSGIGLPSGESLMPLSGAPLSPQLQNFIKTWIDEGANNN